MNDPFAIDTDKVIGVPQSYEDWHALSLCVKMTDDQVTTILSNFDKAKHKKFKSKVRRYKEAQIVIAKKMVELQEHPQGELNITKV